MNYRNKGGIAIIVASLFSATVWAGQGPAGHSHGHG
jgi:hypothetical protein